MMNGISRKRLKSLAVNSFLVILLSAVLVTVFGEINGRNLKSYLKESISLKREVVDLEFKLNYVSERLEGSTYAIESYRVAQGQLVTLRDEALEDLKCLRYQMEINLQYWILDEVRSTNCP